MTGKKTYLPDGVSLPIMYQILKTGTDEQKAELLYHWVSNFIYRSRDGRSIHPDFREDLIQEIVAIHIFPKLIQTNKLNFDLSPSKIYHYINQQIVFRIKHKRRDITNYYQRHQSYEQLMSEEFKEEEWN